MPLFKEGEEKRRRGATSVIRRDHGETKETATVDSLIYLIVNRES